MTGELYGHALSSSFPCMLPNTLAPSLVSAQPREPGLRSLKWILETDMRGRRKMKGSIYYAKDRQSLCLPASRRGVERKQLSARISPCQKQWLTTSTPCAQTLMSKTNHQPSRLFVTTRQVKTSHLSDLIGFLKVTVTSKSNPFIRASRSQRKEKAKKKAKKEFLLS